MSKPTLHLIVFASSLTSRESVFLDHKTFLDALAGRYTLNYIYPEQLDADLPAGATAVFVGSGGVEQQVRDAMDRLPAYVLLIADGLKNSLAASLEILSWMRNHQRQGRVVHGDMDYMLREIDSYVNALTAAEQLRGQRVGAIGKPSGWLISSGVDYERLRASWGIEIVDVDLNEVIDHFHYVTDAEVQDVAGRFVKGAIGMKEPSAADVVKAARLYRAVSDVCGEHRLDAMTLNCFDLIPPTGTTGCLALALLNDAGMPAGCEGDMQTLLTMLLVKAATGRASFMANPSKIVDVEKNEMIFAHCTIAPGLTDRYIIRSHYESLSGVAIEGRLEPQVVTVVKVGGSDMSQHFVSEADLLQCTTNPNMCRTQMLLRLQKPLSYFLDSSIGNHHVIVPGRHARVIETLLQLMAV